MAQVEVNRQLENLEAGLTCTDVVKGCLGHSKSKIVQESMGQKKIMCYDYQP